MKTSRATAMLAAVIGALLAGSARAIPLVSSISENFDSMGTTGTAPPAGWSVKLADGGSSTTWSDASPMATASAFNVAPTGPLAATASPSTASNNGFNAQGANAADRVLATSPTSIAGVALELQLTNASGAAVSQIDIGYEIRRFTAAVAANELPGYRLFYSLDAGVNWTNVAALNPALASGVVQVPNTIGVTTVSSTRVLLAGPWVDGAGLILRWVDDNASQTSPDQIIGLDHVTVAAVPPAGSPPTVQLTSPANGTVLVAPATVNLAATASDSDGTVTKVEFFEGLNKLGEDSAAPFTFNWSAVPAGTYTLSARATDNAGNIVSSVPATLYVNALAGSGSLVRGPYLQKASPTAITVRWRSSQPVTGRVRVGLSPGSLSTVIDESSPVTDHEIALSGLAPGTIHYYSVGSAADTLAGGDTTCSFRTPPLAGTAVNTRAWVLGDAGTGTASQIAVRDAFAAWTGARGADLVLQLGDNAYNSGTDGEFQTKVFDIYGSWMRRAPFWSCLGNHETNQATAFNDSYPYFAIYTLPKAGECGGVPSGTEHYYSWDHGNIHFICLDSMTADRSASGPMATWLASDLASTVQTWIIAFWHHPPYTKGSHDSDTETPLIQMRQNFLPILEAGGVDLVLGGHSHSYERSYLLDGHYGLSGTLVPSMKKDAGDGRPAGNGAYTKPLTGNRSHFGAVYCVAGSAGQVSGGSLNHPAHLLSLNELGSLVLDVDGTTLNATFLRESGAVDDSFSIVKQGGSTPPIATTLAAVQITSRSATLRGSVNPTGTTTSAKFQHGATTAYGTDSPVVLAPPDGLVSQAVSFGLSGLSPGTTYHFRAVASNAWGTVEGSDLTFTTLTAFEDWVALHGLSGLPAAPGSDPDGDGRSNVLEWACGGDPGLGDAGTLQFSGAQVLRRGGPLVRAAGAGHEAVFCRRKDAAESGLVYAAQFSSDLGTWTTVSATPMVLAEDSEIEVVSVPFPAAVNGLPPRFFRLQVTAP